MLGVRDALVGIGGDIEEALYFASLYDVLLDNLFCIRGFYPGVEGIVGNDLHDGASFAETEAAGDDYLREIGEIVGYEFLVEFLDDLTACGCGATCSTAYQNMHFYRHN